MSGEVVSVADTFTPMIPHRGWLELLIHVGLETVALKGECFTAHVKTGDHVKAGDLIAEVDLKALGEKNVNPITPVLVCGGMDGRSLSFVKAPARRERIRF